MYSSTIEVILGPMFSGKSTELIRRASRYESIGRHVLYINHSLDTRTPEDGIKTHSDIKKNGIKTDELLKVFSRSMNYDVICIDEAQFYPDLVAYIKKIEKYDKIIFIAGLDGDFNREPIGDILYIIPMCDKVTKLNALDSDGSNAIFTKRIVDSTSKILIGSNDMYRAVNRKNFFRNIN